MSVGRGALKCSKHVVSKCGVVDNAEAGDEITWEIFIENPSSMEIPDVLIQDDPICMPEIDPASFAWVAETHGTVTGVSAAGSGPLADTVTFAPCSSVKYTVTATVREDPLCPSFAINTVYLEFVGLDEKTYCKDITAEPVKIGVDSSGFEPEPCNPLTLDHNQHAWDFFGGGSTADHAFLVQLFGQGFSLVSLLKSLGPDVIAAASRRCQTQGYDNLQWPPEQAFTSTSVIGVGPPFEGGPGDQP